MITEEQRKERQNGIFSSDVPRIMAGGAVEVYLEKLGQKEPDEIGELEYVMLGNLLEPAALDVYEREVPIKRSPVTLRHPTFNWLGCHLDAIGARGVVEVKAVGAYNKRQWGTPGTDEVPDRVLWQTNTQMAVTGTKSAEVPVVFATEENLTRFLTLGTVEITIYKIRRSEKIVNTIIDRAGDVWGCVQAKIPPKPVTIDDVQLLYDHDRGTILTASEQLIEDYRKLLTLRWHRDHFEEQALAVEKAIKEVMGDRAAIRHLGNTLATWRRNVDSTLFDEDAFKKAHPDLWSKFLYTKKGARPFIVKETEFWSEPTTEDKQA